MGFRIVALRYCFRVLVAVQISCLTVLIDEVRAEGFLEQLLPSWPIVNVGDPIPSELIAAWAGNNPTMGYKCPAIRGRFARFPSKKNQDAPSGIEAAQHDDQWDWDYEDPDTGCDDGDQTTYNGMLCASGVMEGCRSIAEAQDAAGRFYRSPHRKWVWAERCESYKRDPKYTTLYNDRCAYGFSPDMNLGVLLYTLKTRDTTRYEKWLKWLDDFAATTQLCKKEGDTFTDCRRVEWPRVCPEDIGNGQDGFHIPVLDLYGGNCALRPVDAMDFSAVNNAIGLTPPPRMNAWDIQSRALITGVEATAGAILPVGNVFSRFPLIVMSTVDARHFPAHLDAIRVLLRMMILNPGLQLNNLPSLPDPSHLPGLLDAATSDSTDALSINAAAKALALQDGDNPFYALLSEGPTGGVRAKVIDACPAIDGQSNAAHWIWEKGPGEESRKKEYSMGWDCVFVGTLFNRMRVRRDLADELLDLFVNLVDPTQKILKDATQALQIAEAANALALTTLDNAERDLKNAQEFVDELYAQQRDAAKKAINDLTNRADQLSIQASRLEARLPDLRNQASNLPDTISRTVHEQICRWLPPPLGELCKWEDRVENQVNRAKRNLLDQISSLEGQIRDLRDNQISAANAGVRTQTQLIVDLDKKLQAVRTTLQSKTLEAAVRLGREALRQTGKDLYEARKLTAAAKRAYAHLKGNLAVWKNDRTELVSVDLTPVPPVDPPLAGSEVPPNSGSHDGDSRTPGSRDGRQRAHVRASYFSVVGSFHTKRAAERQASFLRRHDRAGRDGRYSVILTFGRAQYWIVSNAAFASRRDALAKAQFARRTNVARDAYILRLRR